MDRRHRQADRVRGQHRHRRLRPRARDGVPSSTALRRCRYRGALRLQCRPGRPGGQARRTRPCHNPFRRCVQDIHHFGNADKCDRGSALAHRRSRRRRGGQTLRGGVDQQETGGRVRHRLGEHVRLLGLGRRPLLGGLRDRAVDHGGDRPGGIRRLPVRIPHRRSPFRHRTIGIQCARTAGTDRAVVLRLLRRRNPRGAALLQRPGPVRGLPAAVDDGIQRQVGTGRRHAGEHRNRGDLLGRAGHQRPARLLPTLTPGHPIGAGRFHRVFPADRRPADRRRHRQHARPADEQFLRPDPGVGVRQDRRRDRRRRHTRGGGAAQGDAG